MYNNDLEWYIINDISNKQAKKLLSLINYDNKKETINKLKEYAIKQNLKLINYLCRNIPANEYKYFINSLETYILKWWC